jgi:hypothetical protein
MDKCRERDRGRRQHHGGRTKERVSTQGGAVCEGESEDVTTTREKREKREKSVSSNNTRPPTTKEYLRKRRPSLLDLLLHLLDLLEGGERPQVPYT